jgi:transcriptional regulator with XRE-family HTH domain
MKSPETLGQRLQRLRTATGLTQFQVSLTAGVALSSLQNWEIDRREPGFRSACRLAKALGVTAEYLAETVPIEEAGKTARPAGPTRQPQSRAKKVPPGPPPAEDLEAESRKSHGKAASGFTDKSGKALGPKKHGRKPMK